MQGAFFLFCTRRGKFTHSLVRPRLCVVETQGAFFLFCTRWVFLFCTRREKFTHSLVRPPSHEVVRSPEARKPRNRKTKKPRKPKPRSQKARNSKNQEAKETKKPCKTRRQYTPSHEVVRSPEARKPRNRKTKKQKKVPKKNRIPQRWHHIARDYLVRAGQMVVLQTLSQMLLGQRVVRPFSKELPLAARLDPQRDLVRTDQHQIRDVLSELRGFGNPFSQLLQRREAS